MVSRVWLPKESKVSPGMLGLEGGGDGSFYIARMRSQGLEICCSELLEGPLGVIVTLYHLRIVSGA